MTLHPKAAATDPGAPSLPRPKHLPLIGTARATPPDLVPARMINEVLYCERLMYLEWVQGEFADNLYTVDGRLTHTHADQPGGSLPQPKSKPESDSQVRSPSAARAKDKKRARDARDGDENDGDDDALPYEARSVWLSSERLGITAKVDVVEGGESGCVVPIEYKRGRAPDLPEGAYLPERAQVCAQVLLLRDHGYRCDEAAIYFAKSKRRVRIEIDDELVAVTRNAVQVVRELAAKPEPPPPLHDSPKCRGCSLSGICLPDEVNLLRRLDDLPPLTDPYDIDESKGPLDPDPWDLVGPQPEPTAASRVRMLYAALDDRVPLHVNDPRAQIGLSGERLVVRGADGPVHVRLMNTSQVVIQGNAQLTTQALRALLERDIPIVFLSGGGYFLGRVIGTDTKNVDLRMAQHQRAADEAFSLALAKRLVVSKIRNCRTMLRRNHEDANETLLFELKQLMRKADECDNRASLLGIEGAAARVYFQAFSGMIKRKDLPGFDFESRNRRPPRDPINALLSYAYALLTKELVITLGSVGLDPLLGFYHQPRFGRPALALDLMEEFRPIVADSVVIGAINTQVVTPDDFVQVAEASNLKPHARRRVLEAYERRMDQLITHPLFGYRVSYRRVLELQARLLSRHLLGELDHYPSFGTR